VAGALNGQGVEQFAGRLLVNSTFWIGWENGSARREPDPGRRGRSMAVRLRQALDPARWDEDLRRAWRVYALRTGQDPDRPPRVAMVGGSGLLVDAEPPFVLLLTHLSRPLTETLKRFNAYSNNDIERLEATLGPPGDLALYLAARWGQQAGAAPTLSSTSGLGQNRLSPRQVVRLLRDLRDLAAGHDLRVSDLLPAAGCDPGTLKAFPGLVAPGAGEAVVVAKTGTLTNTDGGVAVLAGYAGTGAGEVIFCVAAPRSGQRLLAARRDEEKWVRDLLARHGGAVPRACPPPLPQSGDGIQIVPAPAG
jgi:D-alanyl-D-alanine carboxypeptidase